jgi:hypothetical protein
MIKIMRAITRKIIANVFHPKKDENKLKPTKNNTPKIFIRKRLRIPQRFL